MSASRNQTSPLSIVAVVLIALICLLAVLFGVQENTNRAYNQLTAQGKVQSLVADLRAPGDPSTVAMSSLGLAFQIRDEVTVDVSKGMTKPQILQAMVDEYGPDVLAVPRFEGFGMATFVIPLVVLFGVFALVIIYLFKSVSPARFLSEDTKNKDNMMTQRNVDSGTIQSKLKEYL